jgi:hypothetical protein
MALKEKEMAMKDAQFAKDAELKESTIALNKSQLVESQVRTEWLHFQMDQGKRKASAAPQPTTPTTSTTKTMTATTATAMGRTVQKKT